MPPGLTAYWVLTVLARPQPDNQQIRLIMAEECASIICRPYCVACATAVQFRPTVHLVWCVMWIVHWGIIPMTSLFALWDFCRRISDMYHKAPFHTSYRGWALATGIKLFDRGAAPSAISRAAHDCLSPNFWEFFCVSGHGRWMVHLKCSHFYLSCQDSCAPTRCRGGLLEGTLYSLSCWYWC